MPPRPLRRTCTGTYQIACSVKAQPGCNRTSQSFLEWNQVNKMYNPPQSKAKFSTQACQRKQDDGVMVVAKNTAEDSKVAKAFQKSKNRLETKHFKTISGGGGREKASNGQIPTFRSQKCPIILIIADSVCILSNQYFPFIVLVVAVGVNVTLSSVQIANAEKALAYCRKIIRAKRRQTGSGAAF